jgi:UDP-N-acetylmuramate--alanine ligase
MSWEMTLSRFARRRQMTRIHFVGIGGAGMSGIAEVLLNLGFSISGSDLSESDSIRHLRRLGATVSLGHRAEQVRDAHVVVRSTAIGDSNPELAEARRLGIPVLPRAEMLAELMRFNEGIAVSGTHGKTTTTSLIASILAEAGTDPTFVIGGKLTSAGAHARLGRGRYLVAEADESDASFLHLQPLITVVTNIESDHMDTYGGDFDRLRSTFAEFLRNLPFYGLVVVCADDPEALAVATDVGRKHVSYGFREGADYRITQYRQTGTRCHFTLQCPDESVLDLSLNLPGRHNAQNAAAAAAVALEEGIDARHVQKALSEFQGIGRRFQDYGERRLGQACIRLIDDYGHHPSEVLATIRAAREAFPDRRLAMLFQPHRFTRTRDLYEDFVRVLGEVDVLLMLDVYPAGEEAIVGADARALCRSIRLAHQIEPVFVGDSETAIAQLEIQARDGDVWITQGAGNVGALAESLVQVSQPAGEVDDEQ